MDRWRLDVTPHRIWWGDNAAAIQWRSEHLPAPDLGPGHAVAWRARTGRGVLRGVRRRVDLHYGECSDLRDTSHRGCSRVLDNNLARGKDPCCWSYRDKYAGAHDGSYSWSLCGPLRRIVGAPASG